MDERSYEHPEGTQPTSPPSSWTEPETTAASSSDTPDSSSDPISSSSFWPGASEAGSSHGEEPGDDDSGSYPSGGYGAGPGGYPAGGYGSGAYGAYPPGSYPRGFLWSLRRPTPSSPGPELRRARGFAARGHRGAGGAEIAYLARPGQDSAAGLAASPAGRSLTTAEIAAALDPAVVDIVTNLGEGTGMIATSNGEIITNNHVVEGANSIKVSVLNRGTYTATVVGTDAVADVAVLRLTGVSGLATVKFASSSAVSLGSSVVAIGNAGGQGFPSTVTTGAVTSLGRTIMASNDSGGSETLTDMIQIDALIEPGNSGGPLVDSSGEVIGMDTAAASEDGATPMGFALPINKVVETVNDIKQGKAGHGIVIGVKAFLGVEGEAVTIGTGTTTGVGLEYVDPGSPAELAGLQEGDVIVAFDGHSTPSLSELATLIHKLRPGDRAKITFDNFTGGTQTVTTTLVAAPPA